MNKKLVLQSRKLKPYFLLLLFLFVAYLPLSTFYFGMKNDAFSDNFPNKFFFSEAINSGFLPLWNSYLNFGFPIYADPGFAFWNPFTWFFGAVINYNAYTLTLEVLLYIFIAGITMYRLGRHFNFPFYTAFTVAAMYMCSGFFIGQLQHINFITAAAFLPFLLQQFLVLFKKPCLKNACITAIAYYMVFASGHPAIPVATVYFLFTFFVAFFISNNKARQNWKILFQYHAIAVILFILLYSPAIYSYVNIISEYGRGTPINHLDNNASNAGFSPSSYISFLFPFATIKSTSFFADDLAMRNSYFSIAGSILLLTQLSNKNYIVRSLVACSLVMLLLSCGGSIKAIIYSNLPFLSYIKTNGEFRVFSILCFCVIAGHGLSNLESNNLQAYDTYKKIIRVLLVVCLTVLVYSAFKTIGSLLNLFEQISITTTAGIKSMVDNLTFKDSFFISLIINCVLLFLLLYVKINTKKIVLIILLDLIINSIAYLPFTGIGKVTLSEIQQTYDKGKKGITIPPLISIWNTDTLSAEKTGLVGNWSFYNKQIGITALTDYPSYFRNTETYFNSDLPASLNNLPYAFVKSDTQKNIANYIPSNKLKVVFFSPQKIVINVATDKHDSLILLQNHYKFWKAKVDEKEIPVVKSFISFMAVPLNKGQHKVEFYYEDDLLLLFVSVSVITFIILILFIYGSWKNQNSDKAINYLKRNKV